MKKIYPILLQTDRLNNALAKTWLDTGKDIWLSADYHFGGLRYNTSGELENVDDFLIKAQRKTVSEKDIYINLGDLAANDYNNTRELKKKLLKLRGRKILILGNKEGKKDLPVEFYEECGFIVLPYLKWNEFIFSHAPLDPRDFQGATYNIHGHIHGGKRYKQVRYHNHINIYDCRLNDFKPTNLKVAVKQFKKGYYYPISQQM